MKRWYLPVALCAMVAPSGCGSTSSVLRVAQPAAARSHLDSVDWSKVAVSSDFQPMKPLPSSAPAPAVIFPVGTVTVGFHDESSAPASVSSDPSPQPIATRLVTKR